MVKINSKNSTLFFALLFYGFSMCFPNPSKPISNTNTIVPKSASLFQLLDKQKAELLVQTQSISKTSYTAALSLVPNHPLFDDLLEMINREAPDIVVEALFFLPRDISKSSYTVLDIYNTLRAISRLEGLEYYSVTRGKYRVLFEYSRIISDANSLNAIADKSFAELPPGPEQLLVRQKDASFGDNIYKLSMKSGDTYVSQEFANLADIKLGFIKVAESANAKLRLNAILVQEGIVFHIVSSTKILKFPGIRGKLEASFENRAKALFSWFKANYPVS